ncbi:MAG TPA: hypothetical protein VN673_01365 [Clostridia bacterium]|nr:hypothetical protein [Clostridia bacterium]
MKTTFVHPFVLVGLVASLAFVPSAVGRLPAPLFDGLGTHQHPVTTKSKDAQRFFDQGLRLCYGFNHREAIRSFRAAARLDPGCGMAYWGVAYALGPHVNKPMTAEENQQAWSALQEALACAPKLMPRDQAYIQALATRYQKDFVEDRSALDKAYAVAMRKVAASYPDDLDAQTLLAEALMDTMPWDYWHKDRSPKPETEEAFAALRNVMKRDPDHPGANHLYIHAVEAGPNPELGLPSADRLAHYAPEAGHLVHMPSHIYMRVGMYRAASEANVRATKADRSYIRSCAAQGFYPAVYYPHNVHFLWYSRLFEGRSADALRAAQQASRLAADSVCGPNKVLEAPRFRHLPWLTWTRFGQWNKVLSVPAPASTNDFLVDRAMWHFTRGLAFAAHGKAEAAQAEHRHLAQLVQSDEARKLDGPQFPATGILRVAERWLAGKAAGAAGDEAGMIKHLREAVMAEDDLPYMEPAYWPIPVRPALGAALLQAGRLDEAETVFREDLSRFPRNGWGLLGLEQTLRRQGRTESADGVAREFAEAWKGADTPLKVAWF